MRSFTLTQRAKAELRAIAIYTEAHWGIEQRNLYLRQFDDAFHLLAANPALGTPCDDILPGYRKFPQGSHLVFYRDGASGAIQIIRVLHRSMDTEPQLKA